MIEDYFGLIKAPFKLSADPYFYFDSPTHRKAMSYLQYGIQQAEGFVVITGDTGVGKTTLVHQLLNGLDNSQIVAATMDISHVAPGETLSQVLSAFRIEPAGTGASASIEALQEFLTDQVGDGRQAVLIVDEAQNLSPQTLEELRILTNLSYDGLPLLQIFLIGQSEMQDMIARSDMEQFRQRVIASYHVSPLTRDETAAYIDHRLYAAGFKDEQSLFTDRAQDLIYRHTGGVPRRINKLCARVLLQTALDEKDFVDAACVQAVIDDLDQEMGLTREEQVEEPGEDFIPVQDQPDYVSAGSQADISLPVEEEPYQDDVLADDTLDEAIDEAAAVLASGDEPQGEESTDADVAPDDVVTLGVSEEAPFDENGYAADDYADIASEAEPVFESAPESPSNVYPIFSTQREETAPHADEFEETENNDVMAAQEENSHDTEIEEEPEVPVAAQPESRTEEDYPMSVLDRLQAAKRKYFPGSGASDEQAVSDDVPVAVAPEADTNDDFEELGRQLRTQFEDGNVLEQAVAEGDPDARRERVATLKSDLETFLEEVRSGLGDLEQSMQVVNDKITEIEAWQNSRNGLLKDKLHNVETMLDRLQERN
ncbi:AAA family ATPase [Parvularcula flava]|uniref:AAA family ATPase n=1 Tax=Aquisalinus luteolus TaxID=1566827 RepID=A0A8J3EQG5_9PROT|nr:AAA family ATPase [Aquisalinus luteolus]NHK26945.1 AAA family ATPase [Aquisalinus luteolus]GGH93890.1 hypothetical protein GCM10011355_06790 [Aquisalinus luteolus]